ncbi:uncharacterized protein LOC123553567 [Mercenaria mercenaria]|uniref:uncharacterized protein LOC123553567 n=1 Tax=Mercenaria mercenaria TaxID=6596 RepID=UPI00234F4F3B|nr:uncharacterized protein LOC123553567 [Mercenaria mercenaria]
MMDADCDSSIERVLFRVRLDENGIFNEHFEKVLKDKAKLRRVLRPPSEIYMQRRLPGPTAAQKVNFRLAPLLNVQEGHMKPLIADANAWTATGKFGKLPSFPYRASTRETWLRLFSKWDTLVSPASSSSSTSPRMHSGFGSFSTSDSCTPLPVLKRRMPTETFLPRRPTIERPIPLTVNDELFEAIVKSFELKALPFKKTTDSYTFYKTHFPLLLTRITQSERVSSPKRRSMSPDPMCAMINQERLMHERIVELEFMMAVMEKETDTDCEFVTELNSPVFDPTTWPWTKLDTNVLRRRYTIAASLKEV